MLEVSSAGEAAISPDGGAVAFSIASVDGLRAISRVRVVTVAGGVETDLADPVDGRAPAWSPDGRLVVYVASFDGVDALHRLSLDDGSIGRVADLSAIVGRPVFSPRGDAVALVARSADGESRLVRVGLSGDLASIAADHGDEILAPSWSPDGSRLAFARSRPGADGVGPTSSIEVWDWELGVDSRRIETGCAYATCPSWSPDGERLAFVGVAEPRLGRGDPALCPWLVAVSGGAAAPLGGGSEGVVLEPAPEGPSWSDGGDALYLRLACAGAIELVRIDLATGETRTLVAGRQVVDFSVTGGTIACSSIAPDDPGTIEIVTAAGRRRLESSVGEWVRRRGTAMPVPVRRNFRRPDGRVLDGWLTGVDPTSAPRPALLAFHGGPHGFFGPGFRRGHFYRDVLASRGWVVLELNATGSGSYGAEFADDLCGVWGERDLPEHLAALDRLVEEGVVDPTRLAVAGYSYGGYLAAWAIAQDQRFAAAVIGAPITDLESFERTSDIGSWYTPWQMSGGLPENLERYQRLSPALHAAAVTTPALILHGESDRRVPFSQGELLRERLAAVGGAEVELVAYPDADHLFYSSGRPADRLDFNRRIVEWLEAKIDGGGELD